MTMGILWTRRGQSLWRRRPSEAFLCIVEFTDGDRAGYAITECRCRRFDLVGEQLDTRNALDLINGHDKVTKRAFVGDGCIGHDEGAKRATGHAGPAAGASPRAVNDLGKMRRHSDERRRANERVGDLPPLRAGIVVRHV